MSEIAAAIAAHRFKQPKPCHAGEWLEGLEMVDQLALAEYAHEHPTSAYNVARNFGFSRARSTWTNHFKRRCSCAWTPGEWS